MSFLTNRTYQKIQNNFHLLIRTIGADVVLLINSKPEKVNNNIELRVANESGDYDKLNDDIVLKLLLYKSDIENGRLISNIDLWVNEYHQYLKPKKALSSIFFVPIFDKESRLINIIAVGKYANNSISKEQQSIIEVFGNSIQSDMLNEVNETKLYQEGHIEIEHKFQLIFNAVPEAISFNELPSHKTISVNKAFIDYSGYTESEIMGKSGIELNLWANEDERLMYRKLFAKQGFVNNFEAQFINKRGEVSTGLISGKTVSISDKNFLLVIIRNIQDIKLAQQELIDSEKKFRTVFDSLPDYLSISDIATGEFVDVNDYFVENSGYSRDTLLGKTAGEMDMWANPQDKIEHLNLVNKNGGVSNFYFKYKHPRGHIMNGIISSSTVQINAKPYLLSAIRDIDDLIIAQEKQKQSDERFKLFFNSSPDAVNINLYENEVFVDVNASFLKETQYTREEIIGKSLNDFDLWVDKDDFNHFVRLLNLNKEVQSFETQFRKKNGEILDALLSASISIVNGVPNLITITRNITEKKRAQKIIEESETRFRTIVEKSLSSIIIIDDNYHIEYSNPRASVLFGYTEKELLGKNIKDLLPSESKEIVLKRYRDRQNGIYVPEIYEFQIIRNDNLLRNVQISSTIYYDINGNAKTVSQLLDITENKKAQQKNILLAKTAQNYLDIAAVLMFAVNKQGQIIMVNKKACKILEYDEHELLGSNWFEKCLAPEEAKKDKEDFNALFKGKVLDNYSEVRVVTKSKTEKMIAMHYSKLYDNNGELNGVLASGEDITEKLNNVRIINRSRAVTILWKNDKGYPVDYVSDNVYKLTGYSARELMSKEIQYLELIHPEDLQKVLNNIDDYTSKANIRFYNNEYRIITKKNKVKWIEDRTDIHRDIDGNITHFDGVLLDKTEKKLADIEILKSKEKAEESDRLKSSFLANMSHEIRTPMNAIIGFASMLEDGDIFDEEKDTFIRRIRNNGESLLSLINDIIDVSKIEADQVQFHYDIVNIAAFFEEVYESYSILADEKSIQLNYHISSEIEHLQIKSDVNRIRQIMVNLISNAIKFTSPKGKIVFGCNRNENNIEFYVKDNGMGIEEKEQKKMFNRFRQAEIISKTNLGGTGLGLSISKGLVEKMGGKIWLKSKLNIGTTFYISFPL